jgi:membrane fusion protein (multidrug efflux system)
LTEKNPPLKKSQYESLQRRVVLAGVVTLALALFLILGLHYMKSSKIEQEAKEDQKEVNEGPHAALTKVQSASPWRDVLLLGEARPFFDVVIYARAPGYLVQLNVDKGDHVKAGQVLAVIESPEVDKAYYAALSDWYSKKRIADRDRILLKRKLIAQQDADVAFATADVAAAALETQKVLKGYETVVAPFSGTIANRYVDPGALVQDSTGNQAAGGALFEISQNDHLRVYAYPDQSDATFVKPGTPVDITLTEKPDVKIEGNVTRNSELLDNKTRKLLTEIDIDNADNRIIAGSFVQVRMRLNEGPQLEIPIQALALRGTQTIVPVVDRESKIYYRQVRTGSNDGQTVRILGGLKEGEVVALNLGNSVIDGTKVQGKLLTLSKATQQAGVAAPAPEVVVSPQPAPPEHIILERLYPSALEQVHPPFTQPRVTEQTE